MSLPPVVKLVAALEKKGVCTEDIALGDSQRVVAIKNIS